MSFNSSSLFSRTYINKRANSLPSGTRSYTCINCQRASCFKIYSTFACFSTNALYPATTNKCKYYTLIPYHRRLSHYCVTFAENKTIWEIIEGKGGKIKVMDNVPLSKERHSTDEFQRNDEKGRRKKCESSEEK